MGDDPAQAVFEGYNQPHEVPNLFVIDGARDYAVNQIQAGEYDP